MKSRSELLCVVRFYRLAWSDLEHLRTPLSEHQFIRELDYMSAAVKAGKILQNRDYEQIWAVIQ